MPIPPHIAHHIAAVRAFLVLNHIPALVIPADDAAPAQVVAPLSLCPHCRLPIGAAGPHGACVQHQEERP